MRWVRCTFRWRNVVCRQDARALQERSPGLGDVHDSEAKYQYWVDSQCGCVFVDRGRDTLDELYMDLQLRSFWGLLL